MRRPRPISEKPIEKGGTSRDQKPQLEYVSHHIADNENTLDGLKNLYWSIIENAHIGIAHIDHNYKILMANPAMCGYFHKPVSEFVGKQCFREFEKRSSVCPHCPGKKAMKTGRPEEAETEGVRDDGSHIPVRLQAFPTIGPDRTVTGFIEIIEDITDRKKAEQELRESEEKYRDLFENAGEGIITVDLEARITGANKLVEEYGFKREELFRKKLFDFVPEYDRARSVSDFEILVSGKPVNGEMDVITPKGIFTVEYRDNPIIRAGKVIGVQIILTDITEHKKAEQALRESEECNRVLVETAPDVIYIISEDGTLVSLNSAFETITGWSRAEWLGKRFAPLVHPDDLLRAMETFESALSGKTPPLYELRILSKSGKYLVGEFTSTPHIAGGKVVGELGIARDITERKRAEEALREITQTLQAVIQASPLPIFAVDRERNVKTWNPAAERTFGWGAQEVIGRQYPVIPKEKMDEANVLFQRALESGLTEVETLRQRRDGSLINVSISAAPLRDGSGNITGVMAVITDITERKKAEQTIIKERDKTQKYLDIAGIFLVAIDSENRVGMINKKGCEILGYSEDEILGKNWFDNFLPERSRGNVKEIFNKILCGQSNVSNYHENPVLTRSGEERLIAWHNTILRDDKGVVIAALSSGEDITERKKAEEQIAKLAKFPAENPNAILRISAFGTIMYGNKASLPLLKTWKCSIGESLPDRWYKIVLDALSSGQSEQTEIKCGNQTLSIVFAPIVDANYVNIYGLDVTERKNAEQKLLEYQAQLKSLASQLTLAEERERRRIAMYLHDHIGQGLAISKVKLDGLRHNVCSDEPVKVMADVCSLLDQSISDLRSLTFDLSSPILHELGFEAAVAAWLNEEIEQKYGIEVELENDKKLKPLDDDIKTLLFRDVRELLINVVKHSKATKAKVSIQSDGDTIRVGVEDNGIGFNPAEVAAKSVREGRFGLFSIRERLEQLGGHLEIESAPGRGCRIIMKAPLKQKSVDRPPEITQKLNIKNQNCGIP